MQRVLILIALILTSSLSGQEAAGNTIELEIINIDSNEGKMLIAVYDSEDKWLKKYYKGAFSKIKDGVTNYTFDDIPDGVYAVSCFHDEDDDGELDTFLGIPTEDTGASNNAPALMGPPRWKDAKFELNGKSIKQTIKL